MNETTMTVCGNLVDSPRLRRTKNGHLVANFRVASTQRRFDRDKGAWVDGDTLFVSVSAWRALGENVAASLQKGQPVVVHGRYYQRDYRKDEAVRTAYELEAVAVGPDLSRGVASFERVVRPVTPQFEVDETGAPADDSHEYLEFEHEGGDGDGDSAGTSDVTTDTGPVTVDPDTGEVRELAPV
ncbi:single-strand DNA-binding protein [Jatrophihabitans endophyticus]|uniref:Single-stranded DNA-binding protein n=1 Tax=Jatrophihabitans endophyticus TaxID=1206085 RepID=A0A1M5PMQ6_9ACTN|nr:single-stranded DNA-binding protein [Jatrophihabitans endophyticus]SHH02503.1 single-strand DNA-binding protein [Jatrophihabitans endophyticus]